MMVRVILAGFGWWARNRTVIPLLEQDKDLMEIVAITSLKEGREEFDKLVEEEIRPRKLKEPLFFEELNEALISLENNEKPTAVIINTPNKFHFNQAKMALEANVHVYIERPIVCPQDDFEELIQIAKKRNKFLFTGVQRRIEDTYKYIYYVVKNHYYFNQLSSIRCILAAGRQMQNWRRNENLSCGGIVIDHGYHLLDAAAWIADAANIEIPPNVSGSVIFKKEERPSTSGNNNPLETETTAIGYINLPKEVLLSFDLSYHAPVDSIYECIEIRDIEGTKVTLLRDQNKRSTDPAIITHQKSDGSFVPIDLPKNIFPSLKMNMNRISFLGTANNTGPLYDFLQTIQGGINPKNISPCDAELSRNTWRLVRRIYDLAPAAK